MTEAVLGAAAFEQHPLRARILGELHARPTRPLDSPARILHFAFLVDPARVEADRDAVTKACVERGLPGPDPQTRQFRLEMQGATLIWERHGEFITHSWEFSGLDSDVPFSPSPANLMQKVRLLPQPGPLLVAADLHMMAGDRDAASLSAVFGPLQMAVSEANAGRALIATDFAPDTFGFVRIFIANRSMPGDGRRAARPARAGGRDLSHACADGPARGATAGALDPPHRAGIAAPARRHDQGFRRRGQSETARRTHRPRGRTRSRRDRQPLPFRRDARL